MEVDERSVRGGSRRNPHSARIRVRAWVLIGAGLLAMVLAAWSGVQVRRSSEREQRLRAELKQAYQEAEGLRSVAIEWRDRALLFEQQVAALTAERDRLSKRLKEIEAELAQLKAHRPSARPAVGRATDPAR